MPDKRDANEGLVIEYLRNAGCLVQQMDRHAGYDLLVLSPLTGWHILEVKNPAYSWKLTKAELARRDEVEAHGGAYNIVTSIDDVERIMR
jgi:hypothetical protein